MNPSYITSYLPFSPGSLAAYGGGGLAILSPILFYAPSRYRFWIIIGVLLLIGLIFGVRLLYGWMTGRQARASERELDREQQEAEDRANSVEERQKVREIREKFKVALQQLRDAKIPLYDLPWMMLIGEPQGGKTLTLRGSGLSFPVGYDAISGLGGTKNCDWFFANEAVFLDTAGRWTFSQQGASDSREWLTFLGDLVKKRRHCPINGCVVVVPVDALWRSPEKRMEEASNIYNKLGELQRTLKVRFPVFIMITKCDKLLGFTEFFQDFGDLPAMQIFGHSRSAQESFEAPYDDDSFQGWFGELMQRLSDRRTQILRHLQGLDDKATLDRRGRAFELPENFRSIGPALQGYLSNIFARDRYHEPLFFRGVYFSSGIQTGTVSSSAMREILSGLGSDGGTDLAEALPDSRPFFLQDFYQRKVLKETGMVFRSAREIKQARSRTLVTYVGGVLMAVALGALLYVGQSKVAEIFAKPDAEVQQAMEQWEAKGGSLSAKKAQSSVRSLAGAHDMLQSPGPWFRALFPFASPSRPSRDVLTVQNAIFGKYLLQPQIAQVIRTLRPPANGEEPVALDIDTRVDAFREVVSWYATNGPWVEPVLDEEPEDLEEDPNANQDEDEEDERRLSRDRENEVDPQERRWREQAERLLKPLVTDPNQDILKSDNVTIRASWFRDFLLQGDEELRDDHGREARRIPVIARRFARRNNSSLEAMVNELRDAYTLAYLTPNEDSEFGKWRAVFNAISELNGAMSNANALSERFENVRTVSQYDQAIATWDGEFARMKAAYAKVEAAVTALRGPRGQARTPDIPDPKRIQQSWKSLFEQCTGLVDAAPETQFDDGKDEKNRVLDWLIDAEKGLDQQAVKLVNDLLRDMDLYKPYWSNEQGLNPDVTAAFNGFAAMDKWLHEERPSGIASTSPLTELGQWPARLSQSLTTPVELSPPPRTPGSVQSLKPLVDNGALMLTRHQRYLDVVAAMKAIDAAGGLPGFYDDAEAESKTIPYPGLSRSMERRFLENVADDACGILSRLKETDALLTGTVDHVAELNSKLVGEWRSYVSNFFGAWYQAYVSGEHIGVKRILQTRTWPELQDLMASREPEFELSAEAKRRNDALISTLSYTRPDPVQNASDACEIINSVYEDELGRDAFKDLASFKDGNVRFASTFTADFSPLELELRSPNPQLQNFKALFSKLPQVPSRSPNTIRELRAVADHANSLSSANLFAELGRIVAPYAGNFPFSRSGSLSEPQFRQFAAKLLDFNAANKDLIKSQRRVNEYVNKCLAWIVFVYGKDAMEALHEDDLEAKDAVFGVAFGNNMRNLSQTFADVTIGLKRGVGMDPEADQPYTTKRIGIQGTGREASLSHYWKLGSSSEFTVTIYRDVNNERESEQRYPRAGAQQGIWMVPQVIFQLASDVRGRALKPTQAAIDVPFEGSDGGQGVVTFVLSFDVESPPLPRELIGRPPTR